jgi:hypothetical protein
MHKGIAESAGDAGIDFSDADGGLVKDLSGNVDRYP